MNDRRRLRRDENEEKWESPAARRERRERPETASILDLQARAGNRAVQALLETPEAHPALASVQRDPAGEAPASERAEDGKTSAANTMTIPEMGLVTPIVSFQQQIGRVGRSTPGGDVTVSIAMDNLDPRIAEAVAKGKEFATITIALGKATFKMTSVIFTSFSTSSDAASLTLNFKSMEFTPSK